MVTRIKFGRAGNSLLQSHGRAQPSRGRKRAELQHPANPAKLESLMSFRRNSSSLCFLLLTNFGWATGVQAEPLSCSGCFELAQLDPLPPEQRRQMRQQMREHWLQLPPEERRERREAFQQMAPEDRLRVREELRGHREQWEGGERGLVERPFDGRGRR
jgi:hypothetical protein